jgi:hypothetical protein
MMTMGGRGVEYESTPFSTGALMVGKHIVMMSKRVLNVYDDNTRLPT